MALNRRAWILDVGHGNSTVVEESGQVVVIDGGSRDTLLQFLAERGISRVDTVIVSHVDADHFGGISLLLSDLDFQVGEVFLNPDPRDTDLWRDFVSVMRDARARGVRFNLELTDENPGELGLGQLRFEVLHPSQELASRTVTGLTSDGRRLNANAVSAVVRVWSGETPRLLLTADIDRFALNHLVDSGVEMSADVLVFPHHGGIPGRTDPASFAELLISRVGAELVVFSIGRGSYSTPRPEIISAILRTAKDIHVACTQLSAHCAADLPTAESDIHAATSRGLASNACCSGTLEISLENGVTYTPERNLHLEYIEANAPTALCQRGA